MLADLLSLGTGRKLPPVYPLTIGTGKANLHSKNNIQTGIGSGLSELEIGLHLAYQATPTFFPYVGIAWGRPYGKTSDFTHAEGEHGGNTQFLMGFSFEL
jgi:uncharacterized protein involved in copper resistance